jgi:penicillin amidase
MKIINTALKKLFGSIIPIGILVFGLIVVFTTSVCISAEPVSTTRDDKGVWFISGGTFYDVFEAQGYAVATDRLWQAETYRRSARGKLAEVFGPKFKAADMKTRAYGYSDKELLELFEGLSNDEKTAINAYVDGFNRRIAQVINDIAQLPFEFKALKITPEDWSIQDVMAWSVALARSFDPEGKKTKQLDNAALVKELKAKFSGDADHNDVPDYLDMFDDLKWLNDPNALTYIPSKKSASNSGRPDKMALKSHSDQVLEQISNPRKTATLLLENHDRIVANLKQINAYPKMGSYAWAVSGKKTKSGNPILYSGPQMGFSTPVICVEGSIRGGGLNVSGMTVAGIPGIIIGRTPHHAWSMQVGHGNTSDHFIESPKDVFLHREEIIKITNGKGGFIETPVKIYRTAHGPVISPMPYYPDTYNAQKDGPIISWKYAFWGDNEQHFTGTNIQFARAVGMDEFAQGVETLPFSLHLTYIDSHGNIAYWMSGLDPVRVQGLDPRLPQLGDGSHDWPTPVKYVKRSHDRNTVQGYYTGWNNKTSQSYDSPYGVFHRGHVLDDYLSTHNDLTFEELRDLALHTASTDSFSNDKVSLGGKGGNPWKFVADYFTAAIKADQNPERLAALSILMSWDGHFVDGGKVNWALGTNRADAWILMDAWTNKVLDMTFADELTDVASQPDVLLFNVLLHGLAKNNSGLVNKYNWFQNLSDPNAPQTSGTIIVAALDKVLADLGKKPWGTDARKKTIVFKHAFIGEVHKILYSSRSTWAQCVEFDNSGPVRIESMFGLGQSGNILMSDKGAPVFDKNFFSMKEVFDDFSHRNFPLFD